MTFVTDDQLQKTFGLLDPAKHIPRFKTRQRVDG